MAALSRSGALIPHTKQRPSIKPSLPPLINTFSLQHTAWRQRRALSSMRSQRMCPTLSERRAIAAAATVDHPHADEPTQQGVDAGEEEVDEEGLTESQRILNDFLVWLVANGVEGIGLNDSPAALYEGRDGERGLMALKDIAQGDIILRVPLRLAITDHAQDEESNKLVYEDAPWSVRLATKLLREQAKGLRSAWCPYIKVLPGKVPAPLEVFSWEDMQQIEWPPAQAAIYEYNWMVTGAYNRAAGAGPDPEQIAALQAQLAADASGDVDKSTWIVDEGRGVGSPAPSGNQIQQVLGGANADQFQWAMAVVHSRTFANAAKGGGVGVRMLVPLIDMLNHAGDVTPSGRMDDTDIIPLDNVRWDVVSPENSPKRCWEMAVKATAPIPAGSALLLSYGERASDDFFLHYGFVPPLCNPHEDAVVFEDAEEALEWHHNQYATQMPQEVAEDVYARAYAATLQDQKLAASSGKQRGQGRQQGEGMQQQGESSSKTEGAEGSGDKAAAQEEDKGRDKLPKGWQKLSAYANGRVDAALVTAFSVAADGDPRDAELALATRARQMLTSMRTPLLLDLLSLHQDAASRGEEDEYKITGDLLMQQAQQQREVEAVLDAEAAAATPAVAAAATSGTSSAAATAAAPAASVDGAAGSEAAAAAPAASADSAASSGSGAAAAAAPAASADGAATAVTGGEAAAGGSGELRCPPFGTLRELLQALCVQQEAERVSGGATALLCAPLTPSQLLCVRFRAAKKMVLWGVVHRAMCAGGARAGAQGREEEAGTQGGVDLLAGLPQRGGRQAAMVPQL